MLLFIKHWDQSFTNESPVIFLYRLSGVWGNLLLSVLWAGQLHNLQGFMHNEKCGHSRDRKVNLPFPQAYTLTHGRWTFPEETCSNLMRSGWKAPTELPLKIRWQTSPELGRPNLCPVVRCYMVLTSRHHVVSWSLQSISILEVGVDICCYRLNIWWWY